MADLHGVLSAVATPFTDGAEAVDEPALRALVERTVTGGVHGLVPNGSTGEFASMSGDERRHVVEVVIDQAAGRVPVVPHVAALSTREAVAYARHAEGAGADAVMAVAPFYEPLDIDEIKDFYRSVADAVSVPVVVYNLPVATGVNLLPADVVSLARELPNIQYVKDTTGDFSQAARLIHDHDDVIKTLVGQDTLYMAALVEGAAGSINGAANMFPAELASIYDNVRAGDVGAATKTWHFMFPLMQFLVSGGYVSGVKGALDLMGLSAGDPRPPVKALSDERLAELRTIIAGMGALAA
jgi:4-hydroxy-tetrahydrodipicolinate synthase